MEPINVSAQEVFSSCIYIKQLVPLFIEKFKLTKWPEFHFLDFTNYQVTCQIKLDFHQFATISKTTYTSIAYYKFNLN